MNAVKNRIRLLKLRMIAGFALVVSTRLLAHNMPSSAVYLDFYRDGVGAELTLPLAELELGFKQPLISAPGEVFAKYHDALKEYVLAHVNPETEDGRKWTVEFRGLEVKLTQQPVDLVVRLWMKPPAGATTRKFKFNYSVINHEVMSHNVYVAVRNDWDTAVFSSKPEPLGSIHFTITSLMIDRTRGNWWQGFRSVFNLGIHHIAEGTDHLLFLLVLLLPAPLVAAGKRWRGFRGVKRSVGQLLKIVTAFSIGHSLTLLIGSLGWVQMPSRPVEVLIALSIFVSAVHAVRPFFAGREVFIAAGFGLIHGLAFASSIAEFGFSPWYMALTVLGFNLGIEVMQLIVVGVTIPWLILLARTRFYSPVRIAGATFGAVAALGWTAERSLAWSNPIAPMVNVLADHSLWIGAGLAVTALVATAWQWLNSNLFDLEPKKL